MKGSGLIILEEKDILFKVIHLTALDIVISKEEVHVNSGREVVHDGNLTINIMVTQSEPWLCCANKQTTMPVSNVRNYIIEKGV